MKKKNFLNGNCGACVAYRFDGQGRQISKSLFKWHLSKQKLKEYKTERETPTKATTLIRQNGKYQFKKSEGG